MNQLQILFLPMIVYKINYSKWCYKNNFMNVKINVFGKVKMELVDFHFHFFRMLNLILFSIEKKINGNIIGHDMKIKTLFHIIQQCNCYGVLI